MSDDRIKTEISMSTSSDLNTKAFGVRVPHDLYYRLRNEKGKTGRTMSAIVLSALRRYYNEVDNG
jgi:predicted DNA-binding protein